MPAFSRTSVFLRPGADRRRPHDCGCGGKCGSCGNKAARREEGEGSADGRGHDFARIAVADHAHNEKDSGTKCDPETGKMVFEINPICASDAVTVHENVHAGHRAPCCERYGKAWKSATNEVERQAVFDAYEGWRSETNDWSECEASKVEAKYLQDYINLNCEDGGSDPDIGAGIGAGVGAIAGGIGGAFIGQAAAAGSTAISSTAAGVLGAIGGGLIGAGIGALLGFGIGKLVRYLRRDDVSSGCCDRLKNVELWGTLDQIKKSCPGVWKPCPFDADGKIIKRGAA